MVNNAGGSNFMVPFRDLRLTGWDKLIMQLNLSSAVYVCHAFAGHMLDRGTGLRHQRGVRCRSRVRTADEPVRGGERPSSISLTKTLAVEREQAAGVRVNALCPGWTATDLNSRLSGQDPDLAGLTTISKRADADGGGIRRRRSTLPSSWPARRRRFMTGQILVVVDGAVDRVLARRSEGPSRIVLIET